MKKVRLLGLYDEGRRKELAAALIPVIKGECSTIDMTEVDHIDVAALPSLIPAIEARSQTEYPFIRVIGMNEDVQRTLKRTGLHLYFHKEVSSEQ